MLRAASRGPDGSDVYASHVLLTCARDAQKGPDDIKKTET